MRVSSYISPKAKRGRKSRIEGRGLFAIRPIRKGEVVSIKGGHIVDRVTLRRKRHIIGAADVAIDDNFSIAPLTKNEHDRVMMFLNHSCAPNVGVRGEITFVAMRDIRPGEELTLDYAMIDNNRERMRCHCGAKHCRGIVTGQDWRRPELQRKYGRYFSTYLQRKIGTLKRSSWVSPPSKASNSWGQGSMAVSRASASSLNCRRQKSSIK